MDFFHCVLCGGVLLCDEGPERSEHRQINGTCILQEDADNLLDNFFVGLGEGGSESPLWSVDQARLRRVVGLDGCWGLLVAHLDESMPGRDYFAAINVEGAELGLGGGGHEGLLCRPGIQ